MAERILGYVSARFSCSFVLLHFILLCAYDVCVELQQVRELTDSREALKKQMHQKDMELKVAQDEVKEINAVIDQMELLPRENARLREENKQLRDENKVTGERCAVNSTPLCSMPYVQRRIHCFLSMVDVKRRVMNVTTSLLYTPLGTS